MQDPNETKRIVTEQDLANNPDLVGAGVQVGEEIGIPTEETLAGENGALVD